MIILDTNVVSEPLKPHPDKAVLEWLDAQEPRTLFLTTISLAELLSGIEQMPAGQRRDALAKALAEQMMPLFEDRVLPFDNKAAASFARIHASGLAGGKTMKFADCAIAAIAHSNDFSVATRDVRDFERANVKIVNPWVAF